MAKHLDLEEQEQLDQLKHFWNTWGTLISSVLVLVSGAVLVWNGYQYWQNRQTIQAAALYDAVEVAARSGDQARMTQAFGDLKGKYAGTAQAGHAGLAVGAAQYAAGSIDAASEALTWVAKEAGDAGIKAVARLRLASLLMDQGKFEDAMRELAVSHPVEFDAAFADRRGDVLVLQDKRQEAISEFRKAYAAMEPGLEYRRMVEIKLNSLGASVDAATVASAGVTGAAK